MTERPILFSGPMVRAILDGRKTQTRRVVKSFKHTFGGVEVDAIKDWDGGPSALNEDRVARSVGLDSAWRVRR